MTNAIIIPAVPEDLPVLETVAKRTGPSVRRHRSNQVVGTPWEFIRAVEARFGPIAFDLACTRENCKAPAGYYHPEVDALAASWSMDHPEGNLWLNPPFADIAPWAAKCAAADSLRRGFIFLLVPASVGTEWFARHVNGKAFVLGLSPRITFDGQEDGYPRDLMLAVYGYGLHGFDTWRWK